VTELLFIRHGETDWNRRQCFQGQIDVPLNGNGLEQARRLGVRLADDPHDVLFSSDLSRARQTAAPLAAAWGLQPMLVPGLREQKFGEWEGLDLPAIQQRYADLWPLWLEQDIDFAVPGGESLRQFHTRVLGAVKELASQAETGKRGKHDQRAQRLAIVTHGGVLDMLWRTAQGLPLTGLRECPIPNTGLNRLRWAGGTLSVDRWADDEHVKDLLLPT
jgi:probable phosphoglycerate mutase